MDWNLFFDLKDFQRLNILQAKQISNYVLITDRVINLRHKRLSILNRLYTNTDKFLIPANIYKTGKFSSDIIFNWIEFDNIWYRLVSKGLNKNFITDITNFKIIFIDDIINPVLKRIANYYLNINKKEAI